MNSEGLERRIGYSFARPDLLDQALTHRSYGTDHNERLEFLGDGVLNCVIAAELFERFAAAKEGELSRHRAALVSEPALGRQAEALGLGQRLRLGAGEVKSGGSGRVSILADAFEAMIGAVFLDGGFEAAREVIRRLYANQLADIDLRDSGKDPKTLLQELLQARRIALPQYSVVATQGAAHNQRFEVECVIAELSVRTRGNGSSRRIAEQEAARRAFEQLRG
jgi:ribonuclease III